MTLRLISSESVTEGHPDKICDRISDSILDSLLEQDPNSRVAIETLATTGLVHVAGEVTTEGYVDVASRVREVLCEIGYTSSQVGFDGNSCGVTVSIGSQSPDIASGVDSSYEDRHGESSDDYDTLGAGDQGIMFGYACDETPELFPLPIWLAHRLAQRLTDVRKQGVLGYLRPDGKTQVTLGYEGDEARSIETVIVSTQHDEGVAESTIREDVIREVINPIVDPLGLDTTNIRILVNPAGRFVIGGPQGDAGLTGRKIIIDTYGGVARHGGGAFSGKDPSKVDRSGAYAMRWVAKHCVRAGLAERIEVQVAYAIGVARPVGLYVETFGTETVPTDVITAAILETFDLRPAALIDELRLKRPIYAKTSAYGHFGRELEEFTWEQTPHVDRLREAVGALERR